MGEGSLTLIEEEDFLTPSQRFADLDGESQAFVLRVMGLAELNPKTIVVLKRVSHTEARLELRQVLSQEPSDGAIGNGETVYSRRCA